MNRVTIRTKKKNKGTMLSVFLEYNPVFVNPKGEEVRYEFLNLEKYVKPVSEIQKQHNKMIDEIAEAIRCDRYMRMVKKEYSFLLKDKLNESFLDYFKSCCEYYNIKYFYSYKHFKRFCNNKCSFKDLSVSLCEKYSKFLFKESGWRSNVKLKHNTAVAYQNAFLSIVELAYKDGILQNNIAAEVLRIRWNHDTKKEYLEESEIRMLENVDYSGHIFVKHAALLSIYTGLRRADIIRLQWKNISLRYKNMSTISLTIQKTKTDVTLPLSKSAIKLLRSIKKESYLVFPDLSEYILNKEIPLLIEKAKIKKHITFHCFRHTFAMSLLNKGTDIYTIAKLMGHKSVSSTQVYAKLSDEQLRRAVLRL